jgi:hypothetical protein
VFVDWEQLVATETTFKYLLNKAAFIDGITLSVWTQGKPVVEGLVDVEQKPILTSKSIYARYVSAKSPLTGNPVEIWYGKVPKFPRVPNCQMRMRSEFLPLTGSQINETVRFTCLSLAIGFYVIQMAARASCQR